MSVDEPTPGELMRGLNRIETRLDAIAKGFVSVELHRVVVEDVAELKSELAKTNASVVKVTTDARTAADERRKDNAKMYVAFGVAAASVLFSIFGDLIRQSLGLS